MSEKTSSTKRRRKKLRDEMVKAAIAWHDARGSARVYWSCSQAASDAWTAEWNLNRAVEAYVYDKI